MKKLIFSILGIVVSAVLITPVHAEPNDDPPVKPGKVSRLKQGQNGPDARLSRSGAGTQLDQRGKKRSDARKRAVEMRNRMLNTGQQGR